MSRLIERLRKQREEERIAYAPILESQEQRIRASEERERKEREAEIEALVKAKEDRPKAKAFFEQTEYPRLLKELNVYSEPHVEYISNIRKAYTGNLEA